MILAIAVLSFNIHQNLIRIVCIVHATANGQQNISRQKVKLKLKGLKIKPCSFSWVKLKLKLKPH